MPSTSRWREKVAAKLRVLEAARSQYRSESKAHKAVSARLAAVEDAQDLAQQVAQEVQNQAHSRIAEIVTRCLAAVFPNPYKFEIEFVRKRGRTEAKLVFNREGNEVDPLTAAGGGAADVAAFALRLAALLMTRPPLRRVLILDEPFRFVSPELREKVRILLETLTEELDVQILMITHDPQLRAGSVVELRR